MAARSLCVRWLPGAASSRHVLGSGRARARVRVMVRVWVTIRVRVKVRVRAIRAAVPAVAAARSHSQLLRALSFGMYVYYPIRVDSHLVPEPCSAGPVPQLKESRHRSPVLW